MVELGISIDETINPEENKQSLSGDQTSENDSTSLIENEEEKSKEESESIESIPFIAEPSKDKRTRSSK